MSSVILLMDVGGTHTRARLVRAGHGMLKHPDIIMEKTATISTKQGLTAFIHAILVQPGDSVTAAVLSFAGPVYEDSVAMTNWRQQDEISLAELYRLGLPAGRTMLINDMEAAALCLIAYKTGGIDLAVTSLYEAGEAVKKHFNNAVLIIPGTGVGVAGIILRGENGFPATPAYVSCELQHTGAPELAGAPDGLIEAIKQRLKKKVLSWEDMVSGKGLENIYSCLCKLAAGGKFAHGDPGAAEIARRAVAGSDEICTAALDFYYYAAGALTQVMALAFQPFAGVYLGGGTTTKNISFISRGSFVDGLQDNAVRKGLLLSYPVYLVPEYMNLNGTQYLASRSFN